MKTDKDLKELLRDAHAAAEELRCALNDHPDFVNQVDTVLMLVHMASHQAHDQNGILKLPISNGSI